MQTVRRDAHTKQSVSKIKTKAMLQIRRIAFVFISLASRFKLRTSTLLHKAVTALAITGLFVPGSVLVLGLNNRAVAAESTYINFQARILQSSGALVPDSATGYHIEFKLYDSASGGTALWTETRSPSTADPNKATVKNGYISVRLGAVNPFTNAVSQINWDQELYLGMNIGGTAGSASWDGEMTPRFIMTSVPYSKQSKTSLGVTSNNTNATSTNSGSVSISTGNASGATSNSGNLTIDTGTATGTAGTISIGTSNASALTLGRTGLTVTSNSNFNIANSSELQVGGVSVISSSRVLQNVTASTDILTSGTLGVARGGTGASTFTTNGVLFGNGTNAIQATAAGTSGQVLIANASGVPTFTSLSGDVTVDGAGLMTIGADKVALGTDTTGNYVGSVSAGTGLAVTGVAAENWTATVALDYTATLGGNPTLTAGQSSFASTGLIFEGATADTNELLLTVTDPTADRTITLPNESGTICTTGSVCSGYAPSTGGNYLAKNSTDTSSAAVGAASYLYTLTNSGSAATGGVLSLSNGTNTGNILNVVGTGNGTYIFANNTNASPSGNLIDLQSSSTSRFSVTAAGATTIAGALTVNNTTYVRNLTTGTATATDDQLVLSVTAGGAARFNGTITSADLTAARTYTLPDATGTICISGSSCTGLGYVTSEADTLATVTGRGATTSTASSFTGGATIRGLTVDTATATDDRILLSVTAGGAGRFDGTITSADLTANRTYTLPNASGTLCVSGSTCTGLGYVTSVDVSGGTTGLTASGGPVTSSGTITLGGTLAVANGGTGSTTAQGAINTLSGLTTNGDILYYNGTNTTRLARGTDGQCLTSNATTILWGSCGSGGSTLFTDGGTFTYLTDATEDFVLGGTTVASATFFFDVSASNLYLGKNNTGSGGADGTITLYSSGNGVADPTIAANSTGDITIQSTAGSVILGDNSGGIQLSLVAQADVFTASKTFTAASSYSLTDYSFTRTATGGANALSGSVLKVEDTSTFTSGSSAPNVLLVNQNNTSATGNLLLLQTGGSTERFKVTTAGNTSIAGTLTAGSGAGVGLFTNNGATVNTTLALSNFASNSAIGTAAATVDIYTAASVNQTTAGVTLTVPTPTSNTTYGRVFYLSNIGSQSFTLLGTTVNPGTTASLIWSNTNGGATWQFSGADGNGILNQNTANQTANFRITGSGQANTSFLTPTLDVASAGTLSLGNSTATAITLGKAGITTTNAGALTVTQATTLSSTLAVTGNATFSANILGGNSATANTGTTSGTGTNTTTLTLSASVAAFANNDILFIDNAGQDYYTRIVSGAGTASLTVSPAVTFETARTVTEYQNMSNIGATASDYTTLTQRFFQGYFLGGVVTGAGSTTLSDGLLTSTGAIALTTASNGNISLSPNGTGVVSLGSTTTGLQITSAGLLSDGDGDLVLNDQVVLGSSANGIQVTTAGILSDLDGDIILNDQVDIGSSTTGLQVTTAGLIADIDGSVTIQDVVDINVSQNNAVNINTGTSTGVVTIGGGSGTFSLQTTNIDISTAGAITNATGFNGLTVTANTGVITAGTWNGSTIGVAYGGTGTNTTFTQGSILFAGASGVYSQDNSNFFWDNTAKELGIGTNAPGMKLDVLGTGGDGEDVARFRNGSGSIYVKLGYLTGTANMLMSMNGAGTASQDLYVGGFGTGAIDNFRVSATASRFSGTLQVVGALNADTSVYSPIYYDSADSSFYFNGNGTSNLYGLTVESLANFTKAITGSAATTSVAGTSTTTLTLSGAGLSTLAVNDIVKVGSGNQYTRITVVTSATSYTVSPAITYAASDAVQEYNPSISIGLGGANINAIRTGSCSINFPSTLNTASSGDIATCFLSDTADIMIGIIRSSGSTACGGYGCYVTSTPMQWTNTTDCSGYSMSFVNASGGTVDPATYTFTYLYIDR